QVQSHTPPRAIALADSGLDAPSCTVLNAWLSPHRALAARGPRRPLSSLRVLYAEVLSIGRHSNLFTFQLGSDKARSAQSPFPHRPRLKPDCRRSRVIPPAPGPRVCAGTPLGRSSPAC